jgi:hypothetical protein
MSETAKVSEQKATDINSREKTLADTPSWPVPSALASVSLLKVHVGTLPRDRLKILARGRFKKTPAQKIAGYRGFRADKAGDCWRCAVFDSSPDNISRIVHLAQERTRLLERLAVIDGELMSSLPTLLTGIAAAGQTPLKMTDFVVQALEAGYTTKAEGGVSIMVYAGLRMLVERGVLKRDRESQGHVFAGVSRHRLFMSLHVPAVVGPPVGAGGAGGGLASSPDSWPVRFQ